MKETYHGFYGVANNNQLNLRADQGILIATHLDPNAQGWYAKGIDMHSGDSTISLTSSQGNIEIQSDGCAIEVQNNVKTELLAKNITLNSDGWGALDLAKGTAETQESSATLTATDGNITLTGSGHVLEADSVNVAMIAKNGEISIRGEDNHVGGSGIELKKNNNVFEAKNITFEGGNKYGTLELTESTNRITASEKFTLNGGFNRGLVSANSTTTINAKTIEITGKPSTWAKTELYNSSLRECKKLCVSLISLKWLVNQGIG